MLEVLGSCLVAEEKAAALLEQSAEVIEYRGEQVRRSDQIVAHTDVLRNAHEPLDEGTRLRPWTRRLSWCYKYEITSKLAPQARTHLTKPANGGADTSATQS